MDYNNTEGRSGEHVTQCKLQHVGSFDLHFSIYQHFLEMKGTDKVYFLKWVRRSHQVNDDPSLFVLLIEGDYIFFSFLYFTRTSHSVEFNSDKM